MANDEPKSLLDQVRESRRRENRRIRRLRDVLEALAGQKDEGGAEGHAGSLLPGKEPGIPVRSSPDAAPTGRRRPPQPR